MNEPSLTGGCLCGGVRFELTEPATDAGYCHCTRCQRRTGGAASDDATQMSVRLGAFDGDPGVRPTWRAYVAYAAAREPIPDDGLERHDEARPRV